MNSSVAETSPALSSDYADDALSHAIITMRPGWIALRGCVLDTDDAAPARVRYALLHRQVGIALLDVVPGRTTPHAPDHLRRKLDAARFHSEFGCTPPILYFCIPVRALPDAGYLLEYEFSRQPASALPRSDAWVTATQAILAAQPLSPARQVAGRAGSQPPRRARQERQQPARRFGGARLLAAFWGFFIVTVGGGALFLQYLGAPEKAAQAASPPSTADASGPVGADLQRTLIENDQAILALQRRLKGPRPDTGPGMAANAVLIDATLPGAVAERSMGAAIRTEEVDTGQSRALPTPEAATHAADVAQAEAALQQLRADTEAAQKQLTVTNAQVERAGQQLAALQHQSEDTQTAGAAVGKQLLDAQAQLGQLEERRSAAEQQLRSLQAQADRDRKDAADAEARLPEARKPVDPAIAQQAAPGGQNDALAPERSSTVQAAVPTEAAPAVLDHEGAAPISGATAAAASHDNAAAEAAPDVSAWPLPDRAPDPASALLAEMMVRRGNVLLRQGDVSAARLLYGRAASAGSAHAATAMGNTFDATILAGIGVVGLSPDPALAALWYRRALDRGDEGARAWLQSLPPAASHAAAQVERP